MTGFKVVTTHYSGNVTGDAVVWAHEDAARMKEAQVKAKHNEWDDTRFERVEYEMLPGDQCCVGRMIHQLRTDTREDLVREAALAKLNAEERAALGLSNAERSDRHETNP